MSRKNDEDFYEDTADVKCPPQQVPWSNLNEESPRHRPSTSDELKNHHLQKHEYEEEGAIAMEGLPFEEEKVEITLAEPHNLIGQEGIDVEDPDKSGVQNVVTSSSSGSPQVFPGAYRYRGSLPDDREWDDEEELTISPTLSAEPVSAEDPDTSGVQNVVSSSSSGTPQTSPGAYRYRGSLPDDRERDDEDMLTISPTISAEPVSDEAEKRRIQEKVNKALERERQQTVVAEVIPELTSERDRRWKFAGAFLLLVLIVVGVVLGTALRPRPKKKEEIFIPPPDLIALLSNSSSDSGEALRNSTTPQYEALKWLAGDVNLTNYTKQKKIQRYALATLYYSTMGDN